MSSDNVTRRTGRACVKCGGSWAGAAFDLACSHDFGDAPQPAHVSQLWDKHARERLWLASDDGYDSWHPTREGAIANWQAWWVERRDAERAKVASPPEPVRYTLGTPVRGTNMVRFTSGTYPSIAGFYDSQATFLAAVKCGLERLASQGVGRIAVESEASDFGGVCEHSDTQACKACRETDDS